MTVNINNIISAFICVLLAISKIHTVPQNYIPSLHLFWLRAPFLFWDPEPLTSYCQASYMAHLRSNDQLLLAGEAQQSSYCFHYNSQLTENYCKALNVTKGYLAKNAVFLLSKGDHETKSRSTCVHPTISALVAELLLNSPNPYFCSQDNHKKTYSFS